MSAIHVPTKRTSYVVRTTRQEVHYEFEQEAWSAYRTLEAFGIQSTIQNTVTKEVLV